MPFICNNMTLYDYLNVEVLDSPTAQELYIIITQSVMNLTNQYTYEPPNCLYVFSETARH